jgi:hypothetical protein
MVACTPCFSMLLHLALQCIESEPNRGEVWNRVAKHPKNSHEKIESLLKKVGAATG